MRTAKEILERLSIIKLRDWLGTKRMDLILALPFSEAGDFIKPGVTEQAWNEAGHVDYLTDETIKAMMLDYMPYAWEKANTFRGLSAARTLDHFTTWVWLLGDDEALGSFEDYNHYGKDILVRICEYYGWDHSQWDDGVRLDDEPH